ncbi:hypothetical protein GCM10022209_41280 [Chitinophaga oryziterrae]
MLAAAMFGTSCKKDNQPSAGDRFVSATQVVPSVHTLSGVLGTTHNVVDTILLTSAVTDWRLSGLVYVDSADVLIIQPGTTVKGLQGDTANHIPGGGLVVTRGAKIIADGTAAAPIIFTSAAATPASGDWAGIVLLGNAKSNTATRVQVEGIPSNPPADATFGGPVGNDDDNSGILRYVRIEYAGFVLSLNNEINGLTLGGVGRQTVIDYVEVFKSNDDSFEWFGGTVNASHLLSVDALDDMFDTDNGYTGTISFALGLADTTRADQSGSNGFESDNNATGTSATPITSPTYNNVTIVGLSNSARASVTNSVPAGNGSYGRAAHLRRNAHFAINNSIFMGYNYGLSQDLSLGSTSGTFTSNFVHAFINPFQTEVGSTRTPIAAPSGNSTSTSTNPNAAILLGNPFRRDSIPNYIPTSLAPAIVKAGGAFPTGNTTWANGWTKLR